MKLTRTQELALINLGFQRLLENLTTTRATKVTKPQPKRRWNKAQREKYAETMRKKWGNRKTT